MRDIEHALDSADKFSENDIGKDSGADPNACTGNDLLLITTSLLSETFWSQHEGLSVHDVASDIGKKKASLVWNTESFNIVISSPKCANDGECRNTKDLVGGDLNLLQLEPNCEGKKSDCVLLGSPRNTIPSKGTSLIRIDEQESRNFGDLKIPNSIGVGLDEEISRNNQLSDKEIENKFGSVDTLRPDTDTVDIIQDKDIFSGPDFPGQGAECLSYNLKELKPDILLATVECASNRIKEWDQMETCQTSNSAKQPADQGSKSAEYIDLALNATVEYTNSRMTQRLTSLNPVERKCYGEVQMVDLELNFPVVQQSTDEAKYESLRASHKGKSVLIASVGNLNYSNMGKGKEQVTSETEESYSSKRSEDSYDSVESCNSKKLIATGKRERNNDLETSVENKRLKKQIYGGSSSSSFLRKESSFMNWVSTITNGFSRFAEATPLAFAPPPSVHIEGNPNRPLLPHVEGKRTTCRNMGFKSLFQSLYLPGFQVKNSTDTEAAEELKVETEQPAYSSSQMHYKKMEFNLHRILPTDGERIDSASKCHSHNGSINIGSRNIVGSNELHNEVSTATERLNKNVHQVKEFPSIGDSSSPKNGCQSLSGSKGAVALVPVAESSSKLLSNDRNELHQNLWITRFSPKVSSTTPNSVHHIQGMDLATESSTKNCDVSDPQFRNNAVNNNCSKDSCVSPVRFQMNDMDAKKLGFSKAGNLKLKSKLIPILPSHQFQKTEPMPAAFAKKLDIDRKLETFKSSR